MRDPGDVHATRLDVNHEEDVVADQTDESQNLDCEEVGLGNLSQGCLDELPPTQPRELEAAAYCSLLAADQSLLR